MDAKLLPDIFPAAHRADEGALLRVWLLARTVTLETYRIPRATLIDAMQKHLGIQARHAKNLLHKGNQLWWRIDPKSDFVYLIGAKAIATRLGVAPSDALPVKLPLDKLRTLQGFYAACYAAYMQRYVNANVAQPVSRAELQAVMGVTRNTLRRWEKAACIVVYANYAFARPDDFRALPDRYFEYHCNCGKVCATTLDFAAHHATCHEDFVLVWDRPNSYQPPTMATTGTASPIGRARLTHYQRQKSTPDETQRPNLSSSTFAPKQITTTCRPYGWLNPGQQTHYRQGRSSDNLPTALLNKGVAITHLWRACN